MIRKKTFFVSLISLFFAFNCTAQSDLMAKIDTLLLNNYQQNLSDSLQITRLTKFATVNRYQTPIYRILEKAENLAKHSSNDILLAKVYKSWGYYNYYHTNYHQAINYLSLADSLLIKHPNKMLQSSIYNGLGAVWRKKGEVLKAIDYLLKSQKLLEEAAKRTDSKRQKKEIINNQIILFNTLANFYNQMGNNNKSKTYYHMAFKKAVQSHDYFKAGVIMSNKADLLLNLQHHQAALDDLKMAKKLRIKANSGHSSLVNLDQNMSRALLALHKYSLALKKISKAINFYKKNELVNKLMESLIIRSEIYIKQNKPINALTDAEIALGIAQKNDILEGKQNASFYLAKAWQQIGNYKKAFHYIEQYQTFKNLLFNRHNIESMTRLEMNYAYMKEKQRQKLLSKIQKKETENIIHLLIMGLIFLVLLSVLLIKYNTSRRKNNLELKVKNKQISDALALNKTLIRETHHRVKNNLQIVSSLLNMQSKFLKDPNSKQIITDSQNRIRSMSLIHQHLYKGNNLSSLESTKYFTKLLESLLISYGLKQEEIKMRVHIESILMHIDTAIPLGLILNELISNVFKHAFRGHEKSFELSFSKTDRQSLFLTIKDNGPGIPKGFDITKSNSYGIKLIMMLLKKLKADIKFINQNGLMVTMEIYNYQIITT